MGDYPRRRQHRSCDQCRHGKRRCDVAFTPQPNHDPVLGTDGCAVPATHSPCSNCVKWKKECTIEWVRSQEKRRAKGRGSSSKCRMASTATTTAMTTATTARLGVSDGIAPVSGYLSPSTVWSNLDLSAFDIGTILGSMRDDDQHPLETVNQEDAFVAKWTCGRKCQVFSDHDSSCFSSLLRETTVDDDKPPKVRTPRSEQDSGEIALIAEQMASAVCPGGTHQQVSSQNRRIFYSKGVRDIGPIESVSPLSSHYLTEEQHRIDIRNRLLKLYFNFLEDRLNCWIVEKNCPFDVQPLLGTRAEYAQANRLVTRVCKLDKALSTANLLSKDDQKQASRSLALAMMTLAIQWAHLVNGEDELASQYGQTSGLGTFERRLQSSLWQQANQALGEALANPSFKVIYAYIIFSLTQRLSNASDEFVPSSKPDLGSLHIILERDTSPTYLDLAVLQLRQHQRGGKVRGRGHPASRHTVSLSTDDQRTYGVVLWMAVMFDSMSAAINGTSFVFSDVDTNMVYKEFDRGRSISSPSESMSDGLNESADETPLRPDLDLWGNYFLSQQTPHGTVRMQKARWPCSYVDAASCLADGIPILILFYRRIGQLQNLRYRRASLKRIAGGLAAALDVYDHWNATHGLFLEDCVLYHQELSSRIRSRYVLLSSNFNLGMLILSDLIEKLDAEHMTIPSNSTPMQPYYCATSMRLRAAYAISDLARCCCGENLSLHFSESLGINSAIDQSALLGECWPTVLTRSLTYASEIFVKIVHSQKDLGPLVDLAALYEAQVRLDDCINALWLLGRKSDMAACVNTVLRQIVQPEQTARDADPHTLVP